MITRRYSTTLQAVYSELLEQLRYAEAEGLIAEEGFYTRRKRHDRYYWYFRRRMGNSHSERYIGAETPELSARIETLKERAERAKQAAGERRMLVRQLRTGGFLSPDRCTGRLIETLARAGAFRLHAVIVGTHAFRCYPALLGAHLDASLMTTRDLGLAQDPVALGLTDTAIPSLSHVLARAENFIEIPPLNRKDPPTSWRTDDHALRLDVLTPLTGPARRTTVELPALGVHASALRFLDFLLEQPVFAAVLTGSGVLIRVPTPERYALHKLIIASRRGAAGRDEARKDIQQAQSLLEILVLDSPGDVEDAWSDLIRRGKQWQTAAMKSIKRLPQALQTSLP